MKPKSSLTMKMFAARGALFLVFLFSLEAQAQTGTSSVSGTILDTQGGTIAGATVTLTNPATNFSRTQVATESGTYAFPSIPPDTYTLEVSANGFKKSIVENVAALVAKPTEVNVQLEVGAVAETVVVSAGAGEALLNTRDATLGNNFNAQQITQLPLEARSVASLLTLQPGVTRSGYVAGARSDQSNVTLDGVDINEAQTNQIGSTVSGDVTPDGNTVIRLNAEAIEEFRSTLR